MSDDTEFEDNIAPILDELTGSAEKSLAKIITTLIGHYTEKLEDEVLPINQILVVMSDLSGELLARFDDEDGTFVEGKFIENMRRSRAHHDGLDYIEGDTYGLARMTTLGRC